LKLVLTLASKYFFLLIRYRGYDFLNQQLRIVFSNVDQHLKHKLRVEEPDEKIPWKDFDKFLGTRFREAIANVQNLLYVAGDPGTVIKSKSFFG